MPRPVWAPRRGRGGDLRTGARARRHGHLALHPGGAGPAVGAAWAGDARLRARTALAGTRERGAYWCVELGRAHLVSSERRYVAGFEVR